MFALQTVLNTMQEAYMGQSDKCFSIAFLKCDRNKKTGGELVTIARAQKHGLKAFHGYKRMIGIFDHDTGRRAAVHERLIFKFNGQEVYW